VAKYQFQLKERRLAERKKLTGLMPGKFIIDGRDIPTRPVDISEHGLGVLISHEFQLGTKAELQLKDRIIPFEIAWGQQDFGKNDMWRYGLVCTDASTNVEVIFFQTGCLK
jgi:hypothetical protein